MHVVANKGVMRSRMTSSAIWLMGSALGLSAFTCMANNAGAGTPPPNFNAAVSYLYHYRSSYDECVAKAGTSMYGMVDCTKAELAYQDARLNDAYKALIVKLPSKGQAKLKSDENIWIRYRDTNCPKSPNDSSIPVGEYESCALTKTADQANYLEAKLDNL